MIVLSHRGFWLTAAEKNTAAAFRRSFDLGFGTETDVRDHAGELVISHDPPAGGELPFAEFLDLLAGRDLPLAVNVKADGLAGRIRDALAGRNLTTWFVFDMSVPDTLQQLNAGNPVFARLSEYEPAVPELLAARVAGVWLDGFHADWWDAGQIHDWTGAGKAACVVSPELHGRDPAAAWATLKGAGFARPDRVMVCTDRPTEARTWFGGGV